MPWVYTQVTGNPDQLPAIVLCAAVGFVVIMAFSATVSRLSRDK
jgi:hypothetical protein